MSKPQDYLFLLAADGSARLVRHSLVDGGYVTTWRASAPPDELLGSELDPIREGRQR